MIIKALLFREGWRSIRCLISSTRPRIGVRSLTLSTMRTEGGPTIKSTASHQPDMSVLNGKKILQGDVTSNENFTICIEGNIGSGKTTLLDYYNKNENTEVHIEPVNKWRDVQGHNVLGMMYKDPSRWGLTFQTYVQLTMLDLHTRPHKQPIKMMERSIYSAKYCFVENLHKSGKMPDVEYVVITEWFDWILKTQNVKVDLMVYLRTDPEIIAERIKLRHRQEEKGIPLEYLQCLHELHEDWLIKKKYPCPYEVLVLDGNPGLEEMLKTYEDYKPKILQGGLDRSV